MNDRITEDRDWRDGINAFRLKILEQIDGILDVLDTFGKEIERLKWKEKNK